ncbi:RNA polymerase sigma factor [Pseudonocardia alaniniphila]|uniref:Sigma-70 family RNA polymerase sigma factor n=1 Tax=Pseudonocardia alaniniphila TaxID=75291 RepID=A0ABS9TP99_9PSEU|nr:sigma-70 family RNA polymerase sigma factor [Pseudonocardia alaniniphila]MCH6170367.1 sigma-70 family RNA polymerase sigma factor [Pseudonocardia alaniniphila]
MTAPRLVGNDPPQPPPLRLVPSEEDVSQNPQPAVADDSAVLVASLARPDEFALIFDRHAAAIRSYCARRVGASTAEDLVAEVFLTAFEQRGRFDPARAVVPWLFGIATNLLRRFHRQEQRGFRAIARTGRDPVMEGMAERIAERVDAGRFSRELAAALAAMPGTERDVLLLFAWADLGYAEIAEALSIPVGTVRSRLSRGRARLRSALPAQSDPHSEKKETP